MTQTIKRISVIIVFLLGYIHLVAQDELPRITHFTLKNGLEVYLNEDHTRPEIYGAIAVKAGSKYDPADATGMGHYLEHMLFKGTDELGTVNYEEEKIYLDEIRRLYDSLGREKNEDARRAIQLKINEASVKASEYAIPNETDRLIKSIGGKHVNAYTSFEEIVYFNSFAPHQIEKWLDLYSERFRDPVFRLFQSELEVVYEEKNRGADEFFTAVGEEFLKNTFKNHPYGQQSTIGTTEHLKNPSLTKMQEYFNTYYVANNMALIISGDFSVEEIKPLIQAKFGNWRRGNVPAYPSYPEEPFKGREVVTKRLTPIKIGAMAFRTVPKNHNDNYALEILGYILSNEGETGLLDQLRQDKELQYAAGANMSLMDHGIFVVYYLPKIVGQSHNKCEKLINEALARARTGDFDESLFIAAHNNLKSRFYTNFENNLQTGYYMKECFIRDISWDEFINYPEHIEAVTMEDVKRVANQYLNENYLIMRSKMGFPKKDKIKKPPFEPVKPKSDSLKSEYALYFESLPEKAPEPKFVDFNDDIHEKKFGSGNTLYVTHNPVNQIFSMTIEYPMGQYHMKGLNHAADYLNYTGTATMPAKAFKSKLNQLGCTYYVSADDINFKVNITGLEENFDESVSLIHELLFSPAADQEKLELMTSDEITNRRIELSDASSAGGVLFQYLYEGERSSYLQRYSKKELKNLKPADLISMIEKVRTNPVTIHYVGKKNIDEVRSFFRDKEISTASDDKVVAYERINYQQQYQEPVIYIFNKGNARQSHIYLYSYGSRYDRDEVPLMQAFNSYFGGDMSSLVFQEIREFRSLAYAARCYYSSPDRPEMHNYLYGYLGCQGDKTSETVTTMLGLLKDMPQKPERMTDIKKGLQDRAYSSYPFFRSLSSTIDRWKEFGYEEDPNKYLVSVYPKIDFEDLVKYYETEVKPLSVSMAIVAKKKNLQIEELEKYGKVVFLKKNDIRVK